MRTQKLTRRNPTVVRDSSLSGSQLKLLLKRLLHTAHGEIVPSYSIVLMELTSRGTTPVLLSRRRVLKHSEISLLHHTTPPVPVAGNSSFRMGSEVSTALGSARADVFLLWI